MTAWLSLNDFYIITGIILFVVALLSFQDKANRKRWTTGLFWLLFSLVYLVGNYLSHLVVGLIVVIMCVIAAMKGMGIGAYKELDDTERETRALRLGNKLFIPALLIPVLTMVLTLSLGSAKIAGTPIFESSKIATIVSLGIACVASAIISLVLCKETPLQMSNESRRLLDTMGWVIILPQLLAVLGGVFTQAGVGQTVAHIVNEYFAVNTPLAATAIYCLSMALFTIIMGNAFAAFPIITTGIGVPILIMGLGANPAVVAAIGMFSGYCGTLMTPMAANFNIVPVTLLNLPSEHSVIRVQIGTAIPLLFTNIILMYLLAF